MKCIICKNEHDKMSEEHIFPYAIGGSLSIWNVCKTCNDRLGEEVDILLTDNFLISMVRNTLGIKGNSGKVPNPFKEGVTEDNQKIRLLMDRDGHFVPQYIPLISEVEDNKIRIIIDASDKQKLPGIIRKCHERKGLSISDNAIEEILNDINIESARPEIKYDFTINTENYKKALLKILYEMGVYWLGERYTEDPIGKEICGLLFASMDQLKNSKIHGQMGLASEFDFPLVNVECFENMHIACLLPVDGKLCCVIRIFNVFYASVVISENPELYNDIGDGLFMCLDPIQRDLQEMGLVEAIIKYMGA